jgi:ubiquinone/menaquinone biosynthesis C-methylase UbiE
MVEVCRRNGERVGVAVDARVADAEDLPYADGTFDLVVGHAVLHHLPDVPAAMREAFRVLRPGGVFVVAGEPTRLGYALNLRARRATAAVVKTLGRVLPGSLVHEDETQTDPEAALEQHVDLHEFHPHMIADWLHEAGFVDHRIRTEEFVSGFFGWSVRTIEALAKPGLLGVPWATFAFRTYMNLYHLDEAVTRHLVPKQLFYNVLFSARKPAR